MMAVRDGDLVTMFWIRSERESKSPELDYSEMLDRYAQAFAAERMELRWISVDDIVVGRDADGPAVRVRGERIDPTRSFFHTMLMSSPSNRIDAWRHLTTYAALEAAGFFVTVSAWQSVVNNDKVLAALQDFGGEVWRLPTIRIPTRGYGSQVWALRQEDLAAAGIGFPAVVKPVDWDGGNSVFLAHTLSEVDFILRLAAAAELTMVVQPYAGEGTVDYRVLCVDREPVQASERASRTGGVAGNHRQGGTVRIGAVPEQLVAPARAIAAAFDLGYLCVDFLVVGDRWWLSELEIDGGVFGVPLTRLRFGSYRKRFDQFVACARREEMTRGR